VLGDEFLVDGYRVADSCIVMLASAREVAESDAWLKCGVCVLYRDTDQKWIFRGGGHEKLACDSTLAAALASFTRPHAPHSYLVSRALLSAPRPGVHGAHAVLAALAGPWLHRSKAEGDRWAYAGNGERVVPGAALALLSEQWHELQGEASFEETLVFMHTSSLVD